MIHAALSILNQYSHSSHFQDIMQQIAALQSEGVTSFTLDVLYLEKAEKLDLAAAFDVMGYTVEFDENDETFNVDTV